MKEVTILTFDETEHLRNRLDSIIDGLKVGTEEKIVQRIVANGLLGRLKK